MLFQDFIRAIDTVAWPIVTCYGIYIAQKNIPTIINKIRHVKFGEYEVSLENSLNEAEAEIISNDIEPHVRLKYSTAYSKETLIKIAEKSPDEAVIKTWKTVVDYLNNAGLSDGSLAPLTIIKRIRSIHQEQHGLINILNQLRMIRNDVVHKDPNLSSDDAVRYINAAFDSFSLVDSLK